CIPVLSMNDEGKVIALSVGNKGKKTAHGPLNKRKEETYSELHSIFIDISRQTLTQRKESIMETLVAVVLDSSNRLISLFKFGGPFLASTSVVQ
ncbi:hypothetical protein MKX03_022047, partial [Papaver bracteatum]